ncbi:MAG: NADH-quinone oxidoreductase subunit J [Parachlamydiaceae bacterium]
MAPVEWILGLLLVLSALGVILAKKPVHASLSFLATLLILASIYLQLSAQFIAVMQILVYAGAILVLFMFVIILFQDAHQHILQFPAKSSRLLLAIGAIAFPAALLFVGERLMPFHPAKTTLPEGYGTVQSLGHALYVDFFFPFEAVTLLFLVAGVGALYVGRKVR